MKRLHTKHPGVVAEYTPKRKKSQEPLICGMAKLKKEEYTTWENLKKTLTIVSKFAFISDNVVEPVECFFETDKHLYIPRNYAFENVASSLYECPATEGEGAVIPFNGTLRTDRHQDKASAAVLEHLKKSGAVGCIMSMPPGWGKTATCQYILSNLGKKFIFLVTRTPLLEQAIASFIKFGMDASRIGVVQGKKIDVKDKDCIVAMVHSLSMCSYDEQLFDEFGVVVVDECHMICCKVLSRCIMRLPGRTRLGLSATLKRRDGLDAIMKMHIGPVVYEVSVDDKIASDKMKSFVPIVRIINVRGEFGVPKSLPTIQAQQRLGKSNAWSQYIANTIVPLFKEGRNGVVLGHTKIQLITIMEMCSKLGLTDDQMGLFIGTVKKKDRAAVLEKQALFATFHIMEVGVDVDRLDFCALAGSKTEVDQAFGRSRRFVEGKPRPLLLDFRNDAAQFLRANQEKNRFYRKNKFEIIEESLATEHEFSFF